MGGMGARVMVVHGDGDTGQSIEQALATFMPGLDIVTFDNLEVAAASARTDPPLLVVADAELALPSPGEVTNRVRRVVGQVPVVLVPHDDGAWKPPGLAGSPPLRAPFEVKDLVQALETLLDASGPPR